MRSEEEIRQITVELEEIFIEAKKSWQEKRGDYGDAFLELGAKGQFSDIWRKIKKLQRAVWLGYELRHEDPEQVAKEIIPHCVMMIYCLRHPEGLDKNLPRREDQ